MPRIEVFRTLCIGLLGHVLIAPAQTLDGVWRSEGYGYVFEIHGTTFKAFEITARTCLAGFTAERDGVVIPDREATFRTGDGDVYFIRAAQGAGEASNSKDHKLLHSDGSASDMRIDRLERRPAECDRPEANSPLDNFEVFARTWAENYISFDLKNADWDKEIAENRMKVTSRTTPAELFDIFIGMIEPFGDAHTFIESGDLKRQFRGLRPGTDRVVSDLVGKGGFEEFRKSGLPKLWAVTARSELRGPLREFCNGQLAYGHVDDTTGYLRILSFSGYSKKRGFSEGLMALDAALDEIFSDRSLRTLIIDVRINFGGDDPYGIEIASRLATSKYLAYTKYARADAVDRDKWTPGDPSWVVPSSRPGFRGPVVELTGPLTISAGETFTQALMGRTPHVTRVGENTQGVFSDVLVKRLPNGWRFGLPNEVYRTAQGVTFDGPGIPPEIAAPVFDATDVAAGKDRAMDRAVEILHNEE